MRDRKDIDCLTTDELHDLREALTALYAKPPTDPDSYQRLASFHGGPGPSYCAHGAPGFFTWHRAYLMAFENALRSAGCDVTLPFWDWSSEPTTGVPAACRNPTYVHRSGAVVRNPLYAGPRPGGGWTVRAADIDARSFATSSTGAQNALTATTFDSFQAQMDGIHGGVHVRVGGDMGSVPTAAYDPIFWLHHANVDRLWAQWQASHPGPLPPTESDFELRPFPRPFTREWMRGSDTFSAAAMGYRYRRFCLVIPRIRLWEVALIELEPHHRLKAIESIRLAVATRATNARPVEIRAFLDQPDATARTETHGNPAFAGAVALMGHGPMVTAEPAVAQAEARPKEAKQVAVVVEGNGTRTVLAAGADGPAEGHGHAHGHGGEGHGHGHGHGDHSHGEPVPPRGAPVHDPADAHKVVLEIGLTKAFHAAAKDRKVRLKLVAVDGDGKDVREDEAGIDHFHLKLE